MQNKEHYYFPDFKINDELIEIKGNHFFLIKMVILDVHLIV